MTGLLVVCVLVALCGVLFLSWQHGPGAYLLSCAAAVLGMIYVAVLQ